MKPYLLVTGDFGRFGGMDWANFALARHLALRGHPVHLVGFTASEELVGLPGVRFHRVPKPLNAYALGFPLLARVGRGWAKRIAAEGGRIVVNGGNCPWGDINWVHYLHGAYPSDGGFWAERRAAWFRAQEARVVPKARLIVTTADRNKEDLVRLFGIDSSNIRVVPLGVDGTRFRPPSENERAAAREAISLSPDEPALGFVGALGDRRKGFDVLFSAWAKLCADPSWRGRLVVAGSGKCLDGWKRRAAQAGLDARVSFLGFCRDVPRLLWALDGVAAPSRYEPYSLAAQEAGAAGVPCLLSTRAGFSDRYPPELRDWILSDPESADDLAVVLRRWASQRSEWRRRAAGFSASLRQYGWDEMAQTLVGEFEGIKRPSANSLR